MKSSTVKKNPHHSSPPQAEKRIVEVCLSSDGKKLIFLFANGEGFAVQRSVLPMDDGSPVTHCEIFDHGCAAAVHLASGVLYDLPWDSIRHFAQGGDRKSSHFGQAVRKWRKVKGLTQDQLADLCRLSRVHISRIESDVSEPGIDSLIKIAEALGVRLADITAR